MYIPEAGLIVELTNGETSVRRVTGQAGQFLFKRLQPGTWSIRMVGSLPHGYIATYDDAKVEIPPGGEVETTIHLRARRVQYRRIPPDRDTQPQLIGVGGSSAGGS